jgi:hypothetical protein
MREEHFRKVEDIIEQIQHAHNNAGGVPQLAMRSHIRNMKVGELLELLVPNNVEFKIQYVKPENK